MDNSFVISTERKNEVHEFNYTKIRAMNKSCLSITPYKQTKNLLILLPLLLINSCSLFEQNNFIASTLISSKAKEKIIYNTYQTGVDNYRFEFKAINDLDTLELFEYYLNDAAYTAIKFNVTETNDTTIISTNFPTNKIISQTKTGRKVLLKQE